MSEDSGPLRPTKTDRPQNPSGRDRAGRFGPGNRFSKGRPKQSFTKELERQLHMPDVVSALLTRVQDPKLGSREFVEIVKLIAAYTDGRPVSRSMNMSLTATSLPAGFFQMGRDQRARVLDDVRRRALDGNALVLDAGDDDGE